MNEVIAYLFLVIGIVIGAIGSIFLKKGAKNFSLNLMRILQNKEIIIGVFLFGMAMLLYLPALKIANLSVVYPLSSFSYVLISLFSVKYLNENMNIYKWIGIIFIIVGSFLLVSQ